MSIGKNIQKFRKKQNLTQEELAKKIGISKSLMSKIEIDNKEPSFEVLVKISKVLNVLTTDLNPDLDSNSKYKEIASYFAGPGFYIAPKTDNINDIPSFEPILFSEDEIIQTLLSNYNEHILDNEYDTSKITDAQIEELKPLIRKLVELFLYKYAKK